MTYSRPPARILAGHDVAGRLDIAVLEGPGPRGRGLLLCGPDGFMRDMGAALTARGIAPERVATEVFGTVGVHASGS